MSPNKPDSRSVVIIGAGIAGLSAGIYCQMNGYQSRIYEMHDQPGGLMTAWKRKGYTIDGCIHWLTGSSPKYDYYKLWEEIGLIQNREIFDPEVFSRYEGKDGQVLQLFSDVTQLEQHLLTLAPEDAGCIRKLCNDIRTLARFNPPVDVKFPGGIFRLLGMLPYLNKMRKWTQMTMEDLANSFHNPFLRESFRSIWYPEISAVGLIFTLAMLHQKGAGYTIGGSLPMARAVEKRYLDLGGEIIYRAKVDKILVENNQARGIRLVDGREDRSDYVVSAADGHATIFDMLEGRYANSEINQIYDTYKIFPPLVYIGLGVKQTFPELYGITGGISMQLDEPVIVGGTPINRLDYSIHNFDPTLAPEGKTVITVMINSEYGYWKDLHTDPERYATEKKRIALEVIDRLSLRFPGLAEQVEMADIATPVTFKHFTGNWQGSFEGFLPTPATMMKSIPKTLPGLKNFFMVGQWVQAGGGLPSGVMTGRAVAQLLCKEDHQTFRAFRN